MERERSRQVGWVASLAGLAAAAPLASAGTWHVDDDGGPGVDFTDLQPCILAAAPGDTILVAPGTYGTHCDVRIDKPLRVIGTGAQPADVYLSCWNPSVLVEHVDGDQPVVLANLRGSGWVEVRDCEAPVLLLGVGLAVELSDSRDVRAHDLVSPYLYQLYLTASSDARVEAVASHFVGRPGWDGCAGPGGDGGSAVALWDSRAHLARCSAVGGAGGDLTCGWAYEYAGDGGAGLRASLSTVIVAGAPGDVFRGGDGGDAPYDCGWEGSGGPGLLSVSSFVRASGAAFVGGAAGLPCGGGAPGPAEQHSGAAGSFRAAAPLPWLERLGDPAPGATVTLRVHAPAGAAVELYWGRDAVLVPEPGVDVEQLCTREQAASLGKIPAAGHVDHALTLPASWPVGALLVAQAQVELASGRRQNTNSQPLLLR